MKLPEIFIGEGTSGEKKHVKKEYKPNLEDFIIDKEIIGCRSFSIFDIDMGMDSTDYGFLHVRGIKPEIVEKAIFTHYDENTIMLIQYKTQEDINKNLRQLFKKGILFYEKHSETEFIEIFLFKNNIAVYLQGKDDFNKEAANHYKRKGFKQLNYKLEAV